MIKVNDRGWEEMADGVVFASWPGDVAPSVGLRVTVFDRDLEFTQHDVTVVDGQRVTIGPAIPWERAVGAG